MTNELKIDLDWIPVLHNGTRWEKISDNHYLLYNDYYGTKMFVTFSAIAIINNINNVDSIRSIADKLTNGKAKSIDYDRIQSFFSEKLYKNGILETNDKNIKKKKSHIHWEMNIIPENILYIICTPLLFLFKKNTAILILIFCIITIGWTILKTQTFNMFRSAETNYIIFIIGMITLILFHEFGHCTALQYFGKRSKGIGFGFYFFSPILFADVNPSWTLSTNKRMVVDMGGFYFQLIITTIYLLIYNLTDEQTLLNISILSFFLFMFNMNPLINTDMYWFIADYLKYSNLNSEAMEELVSALKKDRPSKLNKFLLSFGLIKILFVSVVFVLITFFMFSTSLTIIQGKYIATLQTLIKDIIIILGFFFFIKEIIEIFIRRIK